MRLQVRGLPQTAPARVERLAARLVHPLCGLDTRAGFVLRGRTEPRFAVVGAELSNVHRLLGQAEAGSYHIGGVGLTRAEALVRALGESVERYCQLVSVSTGTVPVTFGSVADLRAAGRTPLDPADLPLFDPAQYARPGFPFQPAEPAARYGWVELARVPDSAAVWVPAQLVLVGYGPHRGRGEPWLAPAMTTGTATHATAPAATRGALLELVQIDSAMGHWYGPSAAPRIVPGPRLAPLGRLLGRHLGETVTAAFHWLPGPDLPAHRIACVLRQPAGRRPTAAVGLGCETRLADAAYRALLEAVGVLQLARVAMANGVLSGQLAGAVPAGAAILDLDRNVGHYADGGDAELLAEKFPDRPRVTEADLPADLGGPVQEVVDHLWERLLGTGVRLYQRDLTTVDTAGLGLVTVRVWTPDLLALALPSAPPLAHPRFRAYGGARHDRPHPYP